MAEGREAINLQSKGRRILKRLLFEEGDGLLKKE